MENDSQFLFLEEFVYFFAIVKIAKQWSVTLLQPTKDTLRDVFAVWTFFMASYVKQWHGPYTNTFAVAVYSIKCFSSWWGCHIQKRSLFVAQMIDYSVIWLFSICQVFQWTSHLQFEMLNWIARFLFDMEKDMLI